MCINWTKPGRAVDTNWRIQFESAEVCMRWAQRASHGTLYTKVSLSYQLQYQECGCHCGGNFLPHWVLELVWEAGTLATALCSNSSVRFTSWNRCPLAPCTQMLFLKQVPLALCTWTMFLKQIPILGTTHKTSVHISAHLHTKYWDLYGLVEHIIVSVVEAVTWFEWRSTITALDW